MGDAVQGDGVLKILLHIGQDGLHFVEAVLLDDEMIPMHMVIEGIHIEQQLDKGHLTAEVVPGDIVQSGILITNSEVGMGSMSIQPLVYRLVCTNGMVVNDARTRKYHVGRGNEAAEDYTLYSSETLAADDRALLLKVRDTVRAVVDQTRFERVIEMMREAKEAKITSTDIPQMVELAAADYGLNKAEGSGVLDHLIRGGDLSLYGLSNAITRAAQDVESYDRSTEMESIGYTVLGMSRSDWQRLNAAVVAA